MKTHNIAALRARYGALKKKVEPKTPFGSKKVYAYVGGKLVGVYDSISKCSDTLLIPRTTVKKFIDSGEELENGFILKYT